MAPVNGTAAGKGPVHGGKARPKAPVVPAIPLPYLQRRNKSIVSKVEPPPSATSQLGTPSEATSTPKANPKKPAAVLSGPTDTVINGVSKTGLSASEVKGAQANEGVIEAQPASASSVDSSQRVSPNLDRPTATPSQSDSSNANSGDEMPSQHAANGGGPDLTSRRAPDGPQSVLPQSTTTSSHMRAPGYRMPPPFHPQGNTYDLPYMDGVRGPRPNNNVGNNSRSHHPQPSNGSVQFGGFQGSNASSPGPHSSGFAPPPVGAAPNGRSTHLVHGPPRDVPPGMMQYGGEFDTATTMDRYGQGIMSFAGQDGYMPYTTYGPPTPHSFHGSQSSVHADENGNFGQYSPVPGANGHNGHGEDFHSRTHMSMLMEMPPLLRMMPAMPPPHMLHSMMEMDPDGPEFFAGMRRHFKDAELSDCTLELRFADDRAKPTTMPAHRLVLAQSKPLERLMSERTTTRTGSNLVFTVDNKYVRTDALMMALQRLYGYPLFNPPTPAPGSEDLPLAGNLADRFDFVLGYAASGHVLGSRSVVVRGMELAVQFVTWDTLEKALAFALGPNDTRDTIDPHEQWLYGEPTRILLDGVANFIASNIPADFTLDTSVLDPDGYNRIPVVPGAPNPARPVASRVSSGASSPNHVTRPQIARGTSVHLRGQGPRPRVARIKFGDLSLEDGGDASTQHPRPEQPAHYALLSRVLLNLPFGSLKAVVEAAPFGGGTEEARRRLANEVLAEREKRRLAAIEGIKAVGVDGIPLARQTLASVEPRDADTWGVLGFHESLVTYGNPVGAPFLYRSWSPIAWGVDKANPETSTAPAYP